MAELRNKAPELDGINLNQVKSSVLYPGGIDETSRIEGERLLKGYSGEVMGWFTVQRVVSVGNHPEKVRAAWRDIPLPVRSDHFDPTADTVRVLYIDAFNALADNRASVDVLRYWADRGPKQSSPLHLPTLGFPADEGLLEHNALIEWL